MTDERDEHIAEVRTTLDGIDRLLDTARRAAQRQTMSGSIPPEQALDGNGRPMLADLMCTRGNLLHSLTLLGVGRRDEAGDSGLVGALLVLVVLAALGTMIGLDVVSWFSTAVEWTAVLIRDLYVAVRDSRALSG